MEKTKTDDRPQIEKFREVARALGADDADEDRFNAALEKVAKASPRPKQDKPKKHKPGPQAQDKKVQ